MGRCDDDFILRGGGISCGGDVGYISARYGNVLHVIIVSYSELFTCIILYVKWCTYLFVLYCNCNACRRIYPMYPAVE